MNSGRWPWLWILAWGFMLGNPVLGQTFLNSILGTKAASADSGDTLTPAKPQFDLPALARVDAALEQLRQENTPSSAEKSELWKKVRLELQQIETKVQAISAQTEKFTSLSRQRDTWAAQQSSQSEPSSFLQWDTRRDEQYVLRQRQKAMETEVELARDACDRAWLRLDAAERRWRRHADAQTAVVEPANEALHLWEPVRVERVHAAAQSQAALCELQYQELQKKIVDLEYDWLTARIEASRKSLHFSEQEFTSHIQELRTRIPRLQESLREVQHSIDALEQRLQTERETGNDDPVHDEYLKTLHWQLRVLQAQERLLHDDLDRQQELIEVWQRRYQLFQGQVPHEEVTLWREGSRQRQKQLERDKRVMQARTERIRGELSLLQQGVLTAESSQAIAEYRRHQNSELQRLLRVYEAEMASLERLRRAHVKALEEMSQPSAIAAAAALVDNSWRRFWTLWKYELLVVEGSPITVEKVVIGLSLILMGYFLSRGFAWMLTRTVLPQLGLRGNAAAPFGTIGFYISFLTFTLFALRIVCVPLTAFTVVGGALAIGVGVGSQNVASNFISGLILLIERPIRVGDTVEIDGVLGVVEEIGARATRLRTVNNLEVILPNSRVLEQNLTNWTRSDDRIRSTIRVGVAYGSPATLVAELLHQAVSEIESILTTPEPKVLFADFGESALVFDIHYWISLAHKPDRRVIESQLRFQIDRILREHDISIPFPQREIHLAPSQPITVQLTGSEVPGSSSKYRQAS